MRNTLIASLLAAPLILTAAAYASSPKDDASASTQVPRVSTGVTQPRILHTANVELSSLSPSYTASFPSNAEVRLKLNVDENGLPQDIQVVQSLNSALDARVVDAVRQFRWSPAKLDNQAIPLDLTLTVMVQR